MKSVMTHDFSRIPQANIPRSVFDRSHGYKTAFDADYLVPFLLDEVLPGDSFNVNSTLFARLNTPVVPFMDNLHLDTFYFFVPMRLLWTNYYKFFGGQDDPGDSIAYTIPTVPAPTTTGWTVASLADYFGIPPGLDGFSVNTLPFRGYNLVYNSWFRDQNLQDSVVVDVDDGPDTDTDYVLLKRGKRHDYFTSCLPNPQRGDASEVAFGDVTSSGDVIKFDTATGSEQDVEWNTTTGVTCDPGLTHGEGIYFGTETGLEVDDATINSIREAFAIQKLLERDARGGTRYTEIVRSHFGVISPDARLQRPEFLGGSSDRVIVTPVANTEGATNEQGYLAGYGTALATRSGFTKSFTEHGYILGLVNVRADLTYQQGLAKLWSRSTRYDLYWPAFAHLGEQAVLNKEIWLQGAGADANTFGYQERWAEYRYKPSQITGILRSDAASSLEVWHLSQDFASLPTLNSTFITSATPLDRVVATPSEPHFVLDAFIKMRCVRPMPTYSVPGLIDHF